MPSMPMFFFFCSLIHTFLISLFSDVCAEDSVCERSEGIADEVNSFQSVPTENVLPKTPSYQNYNPELDLTKQHVEPVALSELNQM